MAGPAAMYAYAYADDDSDKAMANEAHSLLSHEIDELHRFVQRLNRLRSLHTSTFRNPGLDAAMDEITSAAMSLHAAVHASWEKVVT